MTRGLPDLECATGQGGHNLMPIRRPAEPALILMNDGFLVVVFMVYPSRPGRDGAWNWAAVRDGPTDEQVAGLGRVRGCA